MLNMHCPRCKDRKFDGPQYEADGKVVALVCMTCGPVSVAEFQQQTRGNRPSRCNLEEFPEHAALLGQIAAASSLLEQSLSIAFGLLVRSPPWQVHTAFFEVISMHGRIQMLRALASQMIGASAFEASLFDLLDRARAASTSRNDFVHASWAASADKKTAYVLDNAGSPSKSIYRPVPTEELERALESIKSVDNDVRSFCGAYSNAHPIDLQGPLAASVPESLLKKFKMPPV